MCLNYTCIIFTFFNLQLHVFHVHACCFRIGRSSARNYRAFEKKSISYFINIMYKHIFHNFDVISFINKEMVSLFQLHTYKFGLVHFIDILLFPVYKQYMYSRQYISCLHYTIIMKFML